MLKIDILTLFPNMFSGPFDESIIKRAQKNRFVEIKIHNLRDWAKDERKTVDGRVYGGGVGMLLRIDIIDKAINNLKKKNTKVVLLDTSGKIFSQQKARKLSKEKHIILIAGHYEGIDHRVHEHIADDIISIGNYILTGGEIPTMAVTDSIIRLIPGVLKKKEATQIESFSKMDKIEFPQYTRPEVYKGWKVPKILLSGNHKKIINWRENHQPSCSKT